VVKNLAWDTTLEDLKRHMSRAGDILSGELHRTDENTNNYAVIEFERMLSAKRAVDILHNSMFRGRILNVQAVSKLLDTERSVNSTLFSKRLFISNLNFDCTSDALRKHMEQVGVVASVEILHRRCGRSTGFGVVEFPSSELAEQAVKKLQGSTLYGRQIFLREDREGLLSAPWKLAKAKREEGEAYVPEEYALNSVFVSNLRYDVTWRDLKEHMAQAGPVLKATILRGSHDISLGCGIVVYEDSSDACKAFKELHDTELRGRLIQVREDRAAPTDGKRLAGLKRSSPVPENSVYVGNLSWEADSKTLKEHLSSCGEIKKVMVFESDGRSKGNGVIEFATKHAALRALATAHGTWLLGRRLVVKQYKK